jgi:G3E family GTPase
MASTHNSALTTVVILGRGEVDEENFKIWLEQKLKQHGKNIFRIKGILALKSKEKQFTLQGVHEYYSIQEHPSGKIWTVDDEQLTKVVFIGTGLDREEFNTSFKKDLGIESFWM